MSRSLKTKRKSNKKVRVGTPQYVAPSCEHHGGCPWCEGNRTFSSKKRSPIQIKGEYL